MSRSIAHALKRCKEEGLWRGEVHKEKEKEK